MKWLFLLVIVTLQSCRVYRDVEFKAVKETRFTSFNAKGISCEFEVELFNPNPYRITLMQSDVDLYLEGTRLGKVQLPESAQLNPEGSTLLKLACTAEPASIPKLVGGAIGMVFKKDVVIEGKGSVTAKHSLLRRQFPLLSSND